MQLRNLKEEPVCTILLEQPCLSSPSHVKKTNIRNQWIRFIWPDPDPLQETLIRIRVAKKIVINSHANQPKL